VRLAVHDIFSPLVEAISNVKIQSALLQVPEEQWLAGACPAMNNRCQVLTVGQMRCYDAVAGAMFEGMVKIKSASEVQRIRTRMSLVGVAPAPAWHRAKTPGHMRTGNYECDGNSIAEYISY
jgi:hypothetical protein